MKEEKQLTSVRISAPAKKLWEKCAAELSVSQAAVLEMALRDFAAARDITVDKRAGVSLEESK